ncbi:hypothetical protein PFUGPA_03312 [Plasmodium falciparum Palo Alto/Uganda]|uniref:Uncharacterized protein n=1 Tax=Plasmodium falciparum (isolate Palo Alto / Uganda) TaxID=57270 RepID=W4IXF1_PLAFP|nr:hypothetical protein PFUGPA_03312 [Plasmodium falciparum Palo Alto/Uganda]
MGFFYSGFHKPNKKNMNDKRAKIIYVLGLFLLPSLVSYIGTDRSTKRIQLSNYKKYLP